MPARRSTTRNCTQTRPLCTPWRECRTMLSVASSRDPPYGVGRPGRGPLIRSLARWTRRSITPPRYGRQDFHYHDYDGNYGYEEWEPLTRAAAADAGEARDQAGSGRDADRVDESRRPERGGRNRVTSRTQPAACVCARGDK